MRKALARYIEIADQVARQIRDLQPFTLLPTEHQFASRYGVSRVTIRRALGLLERSGRITRQAGRGTMVSPHKLVRHLVPSCSIDEDFKDQGVALDTQVLGFDARANPPEEVCGYLNLGQGKTAGRLELLRIVEDHIICHDVRYFPPRIADRLDADLAKTQPISEVVQNIARQAIVLSDIETEIAPAPAEVAKQLKITPGMLVATHTFVEYLRDQVPVQLGIMSYRVDWVKFKIVQTGAPFARGEVLPPGPEQESVANSHAGPRGSESGRKPRRKQ
jgi:GntR family transcriptional regulator